MPIPANATWKIESLRLSVFLAEPDSSLGSDWWKDVTGEEPETTTTKRASGERIDEGQFENDRLWLNVSSGPQGKVDWIWYPQIDSSGGFATIGEFSSANPTFDNLLRGWVRDKCPPAIRFAYGATFLSDVESPAAGYEFLQAALPFIKFELGEWSDFTFNVNKLMQSEALAATEISPRLNAFTKWNSIKMIHAILDGSPAPSIEAYAVRMEIDLSSDAANRLHIPKDLLDALLTEFYTLAKRYQEEGFI